MRICFPFNLLLKEEHEKPESIEEAEIGGLGIFFVKSFANELKYEYANNENHLTVFKKLK